MPSHHLPAIPRRLARRCGAAFALSFTVVLLSASALTTPAAAGDAPRTVPSSGTIRVDSPEAAVEAALRRSPALRAAEAGVTASRGTLTQAGLIPNPEFGVTTENIGGSGIYRGTRAAEAVAARRAVRIAADAVRLAEEVLRAARERVSAGREPLLQQRRAEVSLSTARIARTRAEREAEVARRALAVVLAASEVELGPSGRWFDDIGPDPAGRVPTSPAANPDFARWRDEVARANAILGLERRRAIPDMTVGAGVRRFSDTNDTAMVLNLSVPLPVFDRNQGNIARAGADLTRTERVAELNQRALAASLTDAGQRLETACGRPTACAGWWCPGPSRPSASPARATPRASSPSSRCWTPSAPCSRPAPS